MAPPCNGKLLDVADGSEHLFRPGAYADVFGEILPAHNAGAIDQKLCWAGDVVAIGSPRDMQQIVTADYVQFGIRQKREGVARLSTQVRGHLRRVNTDGDWANSKRLEFLKLLLDAS